MTTVLIVEEYGSTVVNSIKLSNDPILNLHNRNRQLRNHSLNISARVTLFIKSIMMSTTPFITSIMTNIITSMVLVHRVSTKRSRGYLKSLIERGV